MDITFEEPAVPARRLPLWTFLAAALAAVAVVVAVLWASGGSTPTRSFGSAVAPSPAVAAAECGPVPGVAVPPVEPPVPGDLVTSPRAAAEPVGPPAAASPSDEPDLATGPGDVRHGPVAGIGRAVVPLQPSLVVPPTLVGSTLVGCGGTSTGEGCQVSSALPSPLGCAPDPAGAYSSSLCVDYGCSVELQGTIDVGPAGTPSSDVVLPPDAVGGAKVATGTATTPLPFPAGEPNLTTVGPAAPPCSTSTGSGATTTCAAAEVCPAPTTASAPCEPADLRLAVPASSAAVGGSTLLLTVQVTSSVDCTLSTGEQVADFVVSQPDRTVVWASTCDGSPDTADGPEACPDLARLTSFQAGVPQTFVQPWSQRAAGKQVPAGTYVVTATVAGPTATGTLTLTR